MSMFEEIKNNVTSRIDSIRDDVNVRVDDFRNDVGTRSKSLLVVVADILETMTKQNLAFANDFAGFAVTQLRLPTQADDFSDYRERNKAVYSKFGTTLKSHGSGLLETLREVPGQIRDSLSVEEAPAKAKAARKAPARKTSAKKVATKKARAKKVAAKKAPAKKAPAKKAAA